MNDEQIELIFRLIDEKCYESTITSCAILDSVIGAISNQATIDVAQLHQDVVSQLRLVAKTSELPLMSRCATQMADNFNATFDSLRSEG